MKWSKKEDCWKVPLKCWADNLEESAMTQASNLAQLPCIFHHVALMPDSHCGFGMPIGGVIALKNCVCPNAVGVDIGCGMTALKTDVRKESLSDMEIRRKWHTLVKSNIPFGEGNSHKDEQEWFGFDNFTVENEPYSIQTIDRKNLSTCGGGNHFDELQYDEDGYVWIMIHSGSRNLGHRIASHFHEVAKNLCNRFFVNLPDKDLAFLPVDDENGQKYINAMNFALDYAKENRRRMMDTSLDCLVSVCSDIGVDCHVSWRYDIHHNYASLENHFGENVWIHRKGATSAKSGEFGIIPGSMGTSSYIVKGLGNKESFMSCSHGAGRVMSRSDASQKLTVAECDKAMDGIVCDRWNRVRRGKSKGLYDLSEAPGAYKDIDTVIANESDLVETIHKLKPLAVVKG